MKRAYTLLLLLTCMAIALQAQVYNEMSPDGTITQRDEYGNSGNFNPNKRDSTRASKDIPIGVKVWNIDTRFGDVIPAELDTMPHLYQNTIYATGVYGEFNTTGNNYSPRQSRIFTDRPHISQFFFVQPYDFTTKNPGEFLFVNTLSPYAHISYESCGDKQYGEDHIDAKFAVNANKRLGMGFDLDYHYAPGYYANQNNSNFRASLFSSYIGNRYQMHFLASSYHRKFTESGGITNDNYITHPEGEETQFDESEIPTVLSQNWNRVNSLHLFLTHRFNIGFYKKVPMTEEELKARQFASKSSQQKKDREKEDDGDDDKKKKPKGRKGLKKADQEPSGRPADAKIMGDEPVKDQSVAVDTTRIKVDSDAKMDSLTAAQAKQDSIDATMKKIYVPVTSFIHTLDINNYDRIYQAYQTPGNYYAKSYYNLNDERAYSGDSIYDQTKYLSIKNTFAVALLEGFNKYMKAGLKGFVSYEYRKFQMPQLVPDSTAYDMNKWTGHCLNVGGQISRREGKTFHFDLSAELGVTGYDAGSLAVDFNTDLNFPLFGDTVRLAAKAYFHRISPAFFLENYHSKHLWWDQSLDKETRSHVEGIFSYQKTDTRLRVAIDEIQNYTYFGMSYTVDSNNKRSNLTGGVYQEGGNINVITAQLMQNVRWSIFNWENVITYQNSSNQNVLPVPALNIFSNLYLKFKVARVLSVELGGCATFFTKYEAPDFLPQIAQYAIQKEQGSKVLLGGYPFVDVYANMHLKRARFFFAMSHVNAGSGTKMQFLAPHYPTNSRIFRMGVSWNFFN